MVVEPQRIHCMEGTRGSRAAPGLPVLAHWESSHHVFIALSTCSDWLLLHWWHLSVCHVDTDLRRKFWLTSCFWSLREVMRGIFSDDRSHLSLAVFRENQNSNIFMFLKMGEVGGWTFCYNFLLRIYCVAFFLRSVTELEVTNVGLTKPWLSLKAKEGEVL